MPCSSLSTVILQPERSDETPSEIVMPTERADLSAEPPSEMLVELPIDVVMLADLCDPSDPMCRAT